ncbi:MULTISPECIES: SRPBCC family protein [unclassified Caballeronia]|uniref:SRPBCC family protein n=1 Tax=unclassified Caballeronia TaxID=2646786 RepID=UPI000D5DFD61|nr:MULTISPECIES: SRPBCC family protein [unclassified Caballeronia]MDR5754402.1 SRPBCC family protein [Caballeronia sp. LZ024]MDR5840780.1 SRPBCC family protein [Caballeronia sp. LZ031]
MPLTEYRFSTVWCIDANIERVWDVIHDAARWPDWWKNVERTVELKRGDRDGVGALHRYVWRGVLPYRVVFDMRVTRVEPLSALEGEASGTVEGTGCWRFSALAEGTQIRYDWHVRTTRFWMNLLAPLARPLFRWNHDVIMREGGHALARRLNARLIRIEQW